MTAIERQQAKCDRLLKKYNRMTTMVPPPIRTSVYDSYCKELGKLDAMGQERMDRLADELCDWLASDEYELHRTL